MPEQVLRGPGWPWSGEGTKPEQDAEAACMDDAPIAWAWQANPDLPDRRSAESKSPNWTFAFAKHRESLERSGLRGIQASPESIVPDPVICVEATISCALETASWDHPALPQWFPWIDPLRIAGASDHRTRERPWPWARSSGIC